MRMWRGGCTAALVSCLLLPAVSVAQTAGVGEYSEKRAPCALHDPLRQPFFGDLHVHTRYSLDASTQGTRTSPAEAYRFAQGERLALQPWTEDDRGQRSLQLRKPLDFAMVSDHAELIGEVYMCTNPEVEGYNSWQCRLYRAWPRGAYYLFNFNAAIRAAHLGQCGEDDALCLEAARAPWAEMQAAAEAHYDRSEDCTFTTFMGYEWTGVQPRSGGNLHRNVVFRNAVVPELPFSYIDGPEAVKLWQALDAQCNKTGDDCEALVIPHNSNMSAGFMFDGPVAEGAELTREYAETRARFEPLVEIMQHKGTSECYFEAGVTEDELCAFEQLPEDNIAGLSNPPQPDTGFVRQALGEGLALEAELGINPYRFGLIASTDTHLGTPGAVEEDRFLGHGGAGVPARKKAPPGLPDKLEYNPGGLAVVWAEENSRDALFNALQRKETYGTSGPRIVARFFAGWEYPEELCASQSRIERAYAGGVPMGGELTMPRATSQTPADTADGAAIADTAAEHTAPRFLVAAGQDPGTADAPGTPLQRVQIIKGAVDAAGEYREQVIDVAGNARNGASVDLQSCETRGTGYAELCTVWTDENFDPAERAFYYARVIENPTCRWSQRMCVANEVDCSDPDTIGEGFEGCCAPEHRPVIQERAWTSPIWYSPAAS